MLSYVYLYVIGAAIISGNNDFAMATIIVVA